jgi:hypothetical protein
MQKLEVFVPQTLLVNRKNPVQSGPTSIKLSAMPHYEPEAWRDDQELDCQPSSREQCRLLDLLGRINYRILSGNRV